MPADTQEVTKAKSKLFPLLHLATEAGQGALGNDEEVCALVAGDEVALETRGPTLEGLEFQDESFGFGLRDLVPEQMNDKMTRTAGKSGLQAVSGIFIEKEHRGGVAR